jgi:hypothetical protein
MTEIIPTADGKIIDCHGEGQTWGCGCVHCLPREHPLDIGMRLSKAQLAEWARMSLAIDRTPNRSCICCGSPGKLYAGGVRCPDHVFQDPQMLSEETREAIGSYVSIHGTSPWPRKVKS